MKIYIAGPVTGIEDRNQEAFDKAECVLLSFDYEVVNPLTIVPPEASYQEAMKTCIQALMTCDGIYLLRNWPFSVGARIEFDVACILGMGIIFEGEN